MPVLPICQCGHFSVLFGIPRRHKQKNDRCGAQTPHVTAGQRLMHKTMAVLTEPLENFSVSGMHCFRRSNSRPELEDVLCHTPTRRASARRLPARRTLTSPCSPRQPVEKGRLLARLRPLLNGEFWIRSGHFCRCEGVGRCEGAKSLLRVSACHRAGGVWHSAWLSPSYLVGRNDFRAETRSFPRVAVVLLGSDFLRMKKKWPICRHALTCN